MIYKLEELQKLYRQGGQKKFYFFWGHTPPANGSIYASCLSQWWKCHFTVDGVAYNCTEQYMMAQKAQLFGDEEMLRAIMNASHPKEMKAFGRAVQSFDNAVWESNCYDIVKRGNAAKFAQNAELWSFMKTTANRILVEASPVDRIWGIGMTKDDPGANDPLQWRGRNLLGFLLTEVRDQLLAQERNDNNHVKP